MITFAVALGSINVAGLRLLCTVGSGAGFALVLLGLRLDRKPRNSSQESNALSPIPSSAHESRPAESSQEVEQQIIYLPADPSPVKSSEMSQQQKVAAALSRRGIADSAVGLHPMPSRTSSALMDRRSEPPTAHHSGGAISTNEYSTLTVKLLLVAGSMLTLSSLVLFLTLR